MPWKEKSIMEQRKEFVALASCDGVNMRELCRRYAISPTTGYKWLKRHEAEGISGLKEQSRKPLNSPQYSLESIEQYVLSARQTHPKWGARKLKRWLENQGVEGLPSHSTVHAILQRNGCIDASASAAHQPWQRFEHEAPNELWQMDFKGHFAVGAERCHALTVLDDHSRFVVCLGAEKSERFDTTQQRLMNTFRRYGLPWRMTMDNGAPWGEPGRYTRFELWLMRQGIKVSHSRPYHPQTQGKDERFHRTLKAEVLHGALFRDLHQVQEKFDHWLSIYNHERPHDSLNLATPATRYVPSPRAYVEQVAPMQYDVSDQVRKVQGNGEFHYRGKEYILGRAFTSESIGLRRTLCEDIMQVYFGVHFVATITLKEPSILIEKARQQ
jgi:transposase InsO family protein